MGDEPPRRIAEGRRCPRSTRPGDATDGFDGNTALDDEGGASLADRQLYRQVAIGAEHLRIDLPQPALELALCAVDHGNEALIADVGRSRPELLLARGEHP